MHVRDQKPLRRPAGGVRAVLAGVALVLVGGACAGAATDPGAASTTAAPAVTATRAPATTTAARPTPTAPATTAASTASAPVAGATSPTTPSRPTTAPSAAPTAAAPSAASGAAPVRFALVAEATEARYKATEQLAGRSLPNDAVGRTKGVSGAIVLDPSGAVVAGESKITVDLTKLQSDSGQRDNFIKRSTLQTSQFPTAEFVPTRVEGLSQPLPTSGEVKFTLIGDLTVRGVTRPVTWDVTAQAGPREVSGTAATTVTFQDFGMTPPKAGPVLGVEDELNLEIDFRAARAA
jgi:polyisoprenoid-binding protein YceI